MARVVHFEIQADDLERAKTFYAEVFGWEYQDWSEVAHEPYWGVITGSDDDKGINGGLLGRPGPAASGGSNGVLLTIQVDDYDTVEKKILAGGGSVVRPKAAMAGMAWQGYYRDTEGNTFGLHQADENAA